MRSLVLIFLALPALAQIPLPGGNGSGGGGGGSSTASSSLTDFTAGGIGTNTLTITCPTGRCNVSTGDNTVSFASLSASAVLAAGSYTAYVWIDDTVLNVGASTIPTSCSSCTRVGSITAYPDQKFQLYRVVVTANLITAINDDRAVYGREKKIVAGAGVSVTQAGTTVTIANTSPGAAPCGADGYIQYYLTAAFGCEAAFTYDPSTNTMAIAGPIIAGTNGRARVTQNGSGGGEIQLVDGFLDSFNFGIGYSYTGANYAAYLGGISVPVLVIPDIGGIQYAKSNARPTCDVDRKGTTYFLAGTPDQFAVCMLNVAGSYVWENLGSSGFYTPTLTGVTNVAASTAYSCQWLRQGVVVQVSCKVDVDPTLAASTSTQLGITLPIASALTADNELAGTANAPAIATQGGAVYADATNDRAQLDFAAISLSNTSWWLTFTYRLL